MRCVNFLRDVFRAGSDLPITGSRRNDCLRRKSCGRALAWAGQSLCRVTPSKNKRQRSLRSDGHFLQSMPWPIHKHMTDYAVRAIYENLSAISWFQGDQAPLTAASEWQVNQPSLPLRLQSPKSLGPGEAVSRERQRADALARHGKDRVAHRRKNRRESGFAEAGG